MMSPRETTFLRKLLITLISVFTPFIIVGVLNLIIMVPQVKANTAAVNRFGEGYISRDEMTKYIDMQRMAYEALLKGYDDNRVLNTHEHQIINARIDEMYKSFYQLKTRGVPPKDE